MRHRDCDKHIANRYPVLELALVFHADTVTHAFEAPQCHDVQMDHVRIFAFVAQHRLGLYVA